IDLRRSRPPRLDRGKDQAGPCRPGRGRDGRGAVSCLGRGCDGHRDGAEGRRGMDGRMSTKGRITAQDVARLAGVSQSAVSRVFTPGASVSPATVEKVRAAAEKLGYRPDALARAMITGRSRIIGLVVAYLENQFYPLAIEKLSRALQARGYHV